MRCAITFIINLIKGTPYCPQYQYHSGNKLIANDKYYDDDKNYDDNDAC